MVGGIKPQRISRIDTFSGTWFEKFVVRLRGIETHLPLS
jgi:hypothetical protein